MTKHRKKEVNWDKKMKSIGSIHHILISFNKGEYRKLDRLLKDYKKENNIKISIQDYIKMVVFKNGNTK